MHKVTAENIAKLATANRAELQLLFKKLKKIDNHLLDDWFHEAHEKVFETYDCLSCANCCRTLGPRVTDTDVGRIAKYLKQKPSVLFEKYFRQDEEGDYVFRTMPCPFLDPENQCTIYESRPKACREYPHTDRRRMHQILDIMQRNCSTCPAVFLLLEQIKQKLIRQGS